jgi:hypothetical protein
MNLSFSLNVFMNRIAGNYTGVRAVYIFHLILFCSAVVLICVLCLPLILFCWSNRVAVVITSFCSIEMRLDCFLKPCRNNEQKRWGRHMRNRPFSGPSIPKKIYIPIFPLRSGPKKSCFITLLHYDNYIVLVDPMRACFISSSLVLISQKFRLLLQRSISSFYVI